MYSIQIIAANDVIEPKSLYSLEEVVREFPRVTAHELGFIVKDSSGEIVSFQDLKARHAEKVKRSARSGGL